MERARHHAERIADDDPELSEPEHALLADALVQAVFGDEAGAPIRA